MYPGRVHGKELVRLQVQRQPKNMVVLRDKGEATLFGVHPLVDKFNEEHETNLRVVSYEVADAAHNGSEIWRSLPICAVDACIAYEKPGGKIGKEIVFAADGEPRVIMATRKYMGEKDIALVAFGLTSADFKKEKETVVLDISDERLVAVPDFPAASGWYRAHGKTGIPYGSEVESGPDARWLDRMADSSYVGLVVRSDIFTHSVNAKMKASEKKLGVVAEVTENETWRMEELIERNQNPETANKTILRLEDISRPRFRRMLWEATKSMRQMSGVVDETLLKPIRELMNIIDNGEF